MTTIYIDGKTFDVNGAGSLLNAILSLGIDLPYFCWHPALGSVGACRQCAVKKFKDEKDTTGRIIMSCMEPVEEGMRISVDDPEAREFRVNVSQWLMANHPHDCPVCDEGGECHLQDMTVMTGHVYRRYRFKKRVHRNQYLGPFINHEMNRCIQCFRCVRFYSDYAGGKDLNIFASHNRVYFGRQENGVLESEFSGNLVEICPTGVFTDRTFRSHFVRKWDLTTSPSICVHCGLGCNIIPGERQGKLRRIRNRFNRAINGYFLCDRGRFGYGFVNSDLRILRATMNESKGPKHVAAEEAIKEIAALLSRKERVIGIGSPRASIESNFVLRHLVGNEHFYAGIKSSELEMIETALRIFRTGKARPPSLQDVARAEAVLILGEDPSNTAPLLSLSLRQAVRQLPLEEVRKQKIPLWQDSAVREAIQDRKGPMFIASFDSTGLDEISRETFRGAPEDIARLGYAVAHAIDRGAPEVKDIESGVLRQAKRIAGTLKSVQRPLVVTGISSGSVDVLKAAANVAWALCKERDCVDLFFCVPESNSLGLGMSGAKNMEEAFEAVREGKVKTAIILENDLTRRFPERDVDEFLDLCETVMVLDHLETGITGRADIVLPVSTFAESDGTLVNNEGRAQRFYKVMVPVEGIRESWRWLRDVAREAGSDEARTWHTLDDCVQAIVESQPRFDGIQRFAPPASYRIYGQKIPRELHRSSGRTARHADISMHEPKPPDDRDSPLAFTMEGYRGQPPPSLVDFYWAPGWNSVQALNKYQSVVGQSLKGGASGIRLIEPLKNVQTHYFKEVPPAFVPKKSEWLVVPLYRIFGSEELSMHSPPIKELFSGTYVSLNPSDARRLEVGDGDEIQLSLNNDAFVLTVRTSEGIPKGVAGIPLADSGFLGLDLPAWGKIGRQKDE